MTMIKISFLFFISQHDSKQTKKLDHSAKLTVPQVTLVSFAAVVWEGALCDEPKQRLGRRLRAR